MARSPEATAELRRLAEHQAVSDALDDIESHQGGRVGIAQATRDLEDERIPTRCSSRRI